MHQGKDSIAEYYSKLKKCNNTINFCKDHLEEKFFEGLSPKYMSIILDFNPLPLVKMLIQRQNIE